MSTTPQTASKGSPKKSPKKAKVINEAAVAEKLAAVVEKGVAAAERADNAPAKPKPSKKAPKAPKLDPGAAHDLAAEIKAEAKCIGPDPSLCAGCGRTTSDISPIRVREDGVVRCDLCQAWVGRDDEPNPAEAPADVKFRRGIIISGEEVKAVWVAIRGERKARAVTKAEAYTALKYAPTPAEVAKVARAERAAKVERGEVAPVKRKPRETFTEEQIAECKRMRAAKATYQEISTYLGHPNDHGNTAWRLLKSL